MNTFLDFLGSDHRACDDLFAAAEEAVAKRNWDGADKLFDQFQRAMARHFAMEENVLFPVFESKTGHAMGPTQVMRSEHDQMRALLRDMQAAVEAREEAGFLGLSETLNMLMQQHNLKEETVLYPLSDRALAGERDGLIQEMDALEK